MRERKAFSIALSVGLYSIAFDLFSKVMVFILTPGLVALNNFNGGAFLLPEYQSLVFSSASILCGFVVLYLGSKRLDQKALKVYAIGLGFLLGAFIQAYEALIFPVVDFIPVHSYMLFNFLEKGWALASPADIYKPLGMLLMITGSLGFLRSSPVQTGLIKNCGV